MKRKVEIVIAGAGVVGLTAATLLARSNQSDHLAITIVDPAPHPDFSAARDIGLRVSAISSGSIDVLRSANAWPCEYAERACAYTDMRVWDATGAEEGPETLHFAASEFALPQLGFIVENQLLQYALLKSLAQMGIGVEFGVGIQALESDAGRWHISLTDGRELRPDLLIGADGGNSFVRQHAGIAVRSWPYAQSAFVSHLRPQKPHYGTAYQRFLRDGPIALLPLADGRVSVVWSTTKDQAEDARNCSEQELGALLTVATDQVLGDLEVAGARGAFPLQASHARAYVLPGLALIGDAAHSVHPLAGQGANLGIADAACLAEVVIAAMNANEVIGDFRVLRRYERARKGANKTMLYFIDGLNRLFGVRSSAFASLRSAGMRLFNRSGPLREYAVRVALGLK